MLGCILLIGIVVGGILMMLGFTSAAKRLGVVILLLALAGPLVMAVVDGLHWVRLDWLAWAVVPLLVLGFIVAFVQFTNRRRAVNKWLGEKKTSAKTRLDSDDA
ncbi:MAG: hypothetical protein WC526_00825 [Patescibacteria group bacterium]